MRDLDGGLREYNKLGIEDDGTLLKVFEYWELVCALVLRLY